MREEKMDIGNQENHEDPQFVKVLETCLKMEIAEAKKKMAANIMEIEKQKSVIRTELNKRKQLKAKVAQMEKIKVILTETLTKLNVNIDEISETLEMMKANIDDQYKLNQIKAQEYQNITAEYKKTWHAYRTMYEEFPLAKTRNAAKINLQKLKIEYMVMAYKKAEATTIIKQRLRIDWIRTRCKIIEFATMMVERSKLEKKLTKLKVNVDYHERELQSIEKELQLLRKKEEDQKKLRKQKVLDMGPPKIDHIPYREISSSNQMRPKMQHKWMRETFDDNISINTLILEELCINENTEESPEIIDVEAIYDSDFKRTTVQVEKSSSIKNVIVNEKTETSTASVEPEQAEAEARIEKADNDIDMKTDNDVNMKETRQEETQNSQESVKTRTSCCTNKNPSKHSAPKNIQDEEIQAKRIRLQKENSKDSIMIAPQSSSVIKKVDSKSPSSIPKIVNIESVHYNIAPISKPIRRTTSIFSSSMFSPTHFECCDSISSFDMSKDCYSRQSSFYEGSLCNYKLSPTSNISAACASKDMQIVSPPKRTLQQNDKNQSDDKGSSFPLSFVKKKDNFTLF